MLHTEYLRVERSKVSWPHGKIGGFRMPCPLCSSLRKPEHQKQAVMSVSANGLYGHCFNCGETVRFVDASRDEKKIFHDENMRILKELNATLRPKKDDMYLLSPKWVSYLAQRGLTDVDLMRRMGLRCRKAKLAGMTKEEEVLCFNYVLFHELINTKMRSFDKHFQLSPLHRTKLFITFAACMHHCVCYTQSEESYSTNNHRTMAKRIPYGISNFVYVIEDNRYYVDKTMYIPKLEKAGHFLSLVRPRRFGKSLLLSMLEAYYDLNMANEFQELFGDLYIGQQPTKEQGQYQVLTLDFSLVGGLDSQLESNFNDYCLGSIQEFLRTYRAYYPDDIYDEVLNTTSARNAMNVVFGHAKSHRYKLYLILDEYDNFTNKVLNEKGHAAYHALTHATGFYRDIFKIFKASFDRVIMTGVSPVTLDDVTSGYNIGYNISNEADFNYLLGFSTEDVREMLNYYQREGAFEGDVEAMIDEMKPWYDNYCFSKDHIDDSRIFNSDMVLYYLSTRVESGQSPESMLDHNAGTDYNKLKRLIDWDHLDGNRKGVLQKIIQEGRIVTTLTTQFPAEEIVDPDIFPSLLYYYGMLTMERKMGNMMVLTIPNNNVRSLFYDYLLKMYQAQVSISVNEMNMANYAMAVQGDWRPALDYIADRYTALTSVRNCIEGERHVQGFMLAMLCSSTYYLVAPELELNHGYCDFFFLPDHVRYPEVAHSYIIELKYLSVNDYDTKCDAQWDDAVKQIHGYAKGPRVQALLDGTQLHCIVVQFKGWEMVRAEEV